MTFRTAKLTSLSTAALLAGQSAFGCSVCSVTNDAARYAYYGTTALLTFLPLLMIGGVVYYIAKKSR